MPHKEIARVKWAFTCIFVGQFYVLILTGLLIRPLPKNVFTFYGKFVRCQNNPCPRPKCTFGHSNLEVEVWNIEKQALRNSMLHDYSTPYIAHVY